MAYKINVRTIVQKKRKKKKKKKKNNLTGQYLLSTSSFNHLEVTHHRWRNGQRACLEYGRSWVRAPVGSSKYCEIGMCCSSAKHEALRRNSKDWLSRNQYNVSEWPDISTRRLLFQLASTITIQLHVLVQYKEHLIIISLKNQFVLAMIQLKNC